MPIVLVLGDRTHNLLKYQVIFLIHRAEGN